MVFSVVWVKFSICSLICSPFFPFPLYSFTPFFPSFSSLFPPFSLPFFPSFLFFLSFLIPVFHFLFAKVYISYYVFGYILFFSLSFFFFPSPFRFPMLVLFTSVNPL